MQRTLSRLSAVFVCSIALLGVSGCVNQHPDPSAVKSEQIQQVSAEDNVRLIATSRASVAIADRLDLGLVGVPSLDGLPERYADATRVGSAMGPDMEIISSLNPTEVFGPDTLGDNLRAGYENAGISATFLKLRSVEGLYESVQYLGDKYDRSDRANTMVDEYKKKVAAFQKKKGDKTGPKVLVLMGLPGSYIECTQSSYVGNMVALAGGVNVVTDSENDFVSWNTEDLLATDPDIILRTVHALPEQVQEMFDDEFKTNDIWSHFRAVKENRVYDLNYKIFGMSATFDWAEGLDDLYDLFYMGDGS